MYVGFLYFSSTSVQSCANPSPLTHFGCSIRFAPPLVISEAELVKALDIIKSSLEDLDKVRVGSHRLAAYFNAGRTVLN